MTDGSPPFSTGNIHTPEGLQNAHFPLSPSNSMCQCGTWNLPNSFYCSNFSCPSHVIQMHHCSSPTSPQSSQFGSFSLGSNSILRQNTHPEEDHGSWSLISWTTASSEERACHPEAHLLPEFASPYSQGNATDYREPSSQFQIASVAPLLLSSPLNNSQELARFPALVSEDMDLRMRGRIEDQSDALGEGHSAIGPRYSLDDLKHWWHSTAPRLQRMRDGCPPVKVIPCIYYRECEATFVYENGLGNFNRHVQNKHELKKFKCHRCAKFLSRRDALGKHMKTRHENEP